MKPFCINEECPDFLPEDKRGYTRKPKSHDGHRRECRARSPRLRRDGKKLPRRAKTSKTAEDSAKAGQDARRRPPKDQPEEAAAAQNQTKATGRARHDRSKRDRRGTWRACEAAWQLAERGFAGRACPR
ncbi:MAG: hypothetical protein ACLU9S_12860 [Oscillospiraceae bacterium]